MRIFIIGAGEVGAHIASALAQEGHDLVIVDTDLERVQAIQSELDVMGVLADGSLSSTLKANNIAQAELVFAVSNDDAANLLSVLTARRLGAGKCVVRLGNPGHGESPLLEDEGILPLYPERLVAEEVIGLTKVPGASKAHFFEDGQLLLLRARPGAKAQIYGKSLRDLTLPKGWILVGVERGMKLSIPTGDTVLRPGQRLYALGYPESASEFLATIGIEAPPIRKVVVAGGGHVGRWLAHRLVEDGVRVTVLQRDRDKAFALATDIPEALVLHGDATDLTLLKEADVGNADYFVAATQDDETNVISSYLARESGARTVVALYQRPEFVNVLRAARVDIGLSPRLITAGTILKMVHRREILSLDLVASGEAEVVEFQVPARCRALRAPLSKLRFPSGAIVGAVMRGDQRIVPGGNFSFQEGDRALVFSLADSLVALEKLFRGK